MILLAQLGMKKYIIKGGITLKGEIAVAGAKNVALKALVAACLTDQEVAIDNVPLISDLFIMADIIKELGGSVELNGHRLKVRIDNVKKNKITLDKASQIRTSSMFLAPLLARTGVAIIPNPGGCRIGARPIDRIVEGLQKLGCSIVYDSDDGYFHAKTKGLIGTVYQFEKNTHTGTETMILASVLAGGRTVLENAAQEPEIDELIALLNSMGGKVVRSSPRTIVIDGVEKLKGAKLTIGPDRNEVVTFAIAGLATAGDVTVLGANKNSIKAFLDKLEECGANWQQVDKGIRFWGGQLKATDVVTSYFPGFMTDWQGPWAVLMSRAAGDSTIHETVYENRFSYVEELVKMGAKIELFNPKVKNPEAVYNFNWTDNKDEYSHAAKIFGPTSLHNAVLSISDLRAGATLVLAALSAQGENVIFGVEHIDRGYENFEGRLKKLGANIKRVED